MPDLERVLDAVKALRAIGFDTMEFTRLVGGIAEEMNRAERLEEAFDFNAGGIFRCKEVPHD